MSKKQSKSYFRDDELLVLIGFQLRAVREEVGLTQEDLANACDFEISQISRIERGKSNTSISSLNHILINLNQSLPEFFTALDDLKMKQQGELGQNN